MTELKYPVLLVHGTLFRDTDFFCYWGRIPKALRRAGCKVYLSLQDSNGTVEHNGEFLCRRIKTILCDSGAEKLNVIAFSKGGLDMRYVISSMGMSRYIASLTTISTPHNGSKTMDLMLEKHPYLMTLFSVCSDFCMSALGDEKPEAYKVYKLLSTDGAREFNEKNPDMPGVYYQSFAFTFKTNFSDVLLSVPHSFIKHIEGEIDGLVTPENAAHGNFRGVYHGVGNRGISHLDAIDFRRLPLSHKKGKGIYDITAFYILIAKDLQKRGF